MLHTKIRMTADFLPAVMPARRHCSSILNLLGPFMYKVD